MNSGELGRQVEETSILASVSYQNLSFPSFLYSSLPRSLPHSLPLSFPPFLPSSIRSTNLCQTFAEGLWVLALPVVFSRSQWFRVCLRAASDQLATLGCRNPGKAWVPSPLVLTTEECVWLPALLFGKPSGAAAPFLLQSFQPAGGTKERGSLRPEGDSLASAGRYGCAWD